MAAALRAPAAAAAARALRASGPAPRRLASARGGAASAGGLLAAAPAAAALVAWLKAGGGEEATGGSRAAHAQVHTSEAGGEEVKPAAALPVFQTRVQQMVRGGDVRNASDWVFQDLGLDQSGNLRCIGKVGDALYHTREDLTKASVKALPEGAACVPFCFCIQVPGSQPVIFAAASSAARELWMQELASVARMPSA